MRVLRAAVLATVLCLAYCEEAHPEGTEPADEGLDREVEQKDHPDHVDGEPGDGPPGHDEHVDTYDPEKAEAARIAEQQKYKETIKQHLEDSFASWDTNSDGKLSRDELKAHMTAVHEQNQATHEKEARKEAKKAIVLHGNKPFTLQDLLEYRKIHHDLTNIRDKRQAHIDEHGEPPAEHDDAYMQKVAIAEAFWAMETFVDDEMMTLFFNHLDDDKSGDLKGDEVTGMIDPRLPKYAAIWESLDVERLYKSSDTDKDGRLTFEELAEHGFTQEEHGDELDHNNDTYVSLEEFQKFSGVHPEHRQEHDEVELNLQYLVESTAGKDGAVSLKELTASMMEADHGVEHHFVPRHLLDEHAEGTWAKDEL